MDLNGLAWALRTSRTSMVGRPVQRKQKPCTGCSAALSRGELYYQPRVWRPGMGWYDKLCATCMAQAIGGRYCKSAKDEGFVARLAAMSGLLDVDIARNPNEAPPKPKPKPNPAPPMPPPPSS
eukprot:2855585-Prymnesium_polylepis.1